MSLRKLFRLLLAIQVALGVGLAILSASLFLNQVELSRSQHVQFQSYLLADELRQSSDDLTRLARTYVATGDANYEREYWTVLAIRNGTHPRPVSYNRIYWDFVAVSEESVRPDGETIPLRALMIKEGFTKAELEKLSLAQQASDRLVRTELIAMNAVKGLFDDGAGHFTVRKAPDRALAMRIMNDRTYHEDKVAIMGPIDDFYVLFEERTAGSVAMYERRSLYLLQALGALIAVIMGMFGVSFVTVRRQVTERERAEEALTSSLGLVEATLESTDNGILVISSGGAVVKANGRFAELWHIPGDILASGDDGKLIGHVLDQLSDPDAFLAGVKALYGDPRAESADLLAFKDGRVFERTSRPMLVGGEPKARVWSFLDITERRRAEAALEASLANLRAVFEGSPQIFILMSAAGVVEAFNGQASVRSVAALGSELRTGVPFAALVPEAGAERLRTHFAQALRGETAYGEWEYVAPEGGVAWLDLIYSPVFDQHGGVRGVLLSATDVTARRAAEWALRESEERFRSVYEDATVGLYRTTPDGRILLANPALVRMLRYASFEDLAMRDLEHGDAYEPGYARSEFRRQIDSSGEVRGLESEWRRKDGTTLMVRESARAVRDASGVPLYYDGVVEDVTERRMAELALRESEARFRSLFEHSHVVMLLVDPASRTIVEANGTADAFYGYGPGGLSRRAFADLLAERADADALFVEGGRAAAPGGLRSRHRLAGGDMRDVEVHAGELVQHGAPLLLCIVHDVSERLRVEAEQARLQQREVEIQRLEGMAVMAGGVAHDFNNLLTGVLANVSLARGEGPIGADLPRYLDEIEQAGQRAADLSRQMLAYTGKRHLALEVLDVSRVVRDSVAILEASVSKKIRIETTLAPDLPRVEADPAQVQQVLLSLVVNAAEATGAVGGTVRVRTAVRMADRALFAEAHLSPNLPEGPYVALEVTDDGQGMDPETVARMFDPFFTTRFTGRGLGLAAVLGIVRGHKGAVLVRSAPGRGTTVTVLLPAAMGGTVTTAFGGPSRP